MIKNLPLGAGSSSAVQRLLDQHGFQGFYDFIYVPVTRYHQHLRVEAGVPGFAEVRFLTGIPFGHAFVNFTSPSACHQFHCLAAEFERQQLILCWAEIQGLQEQIKRYRNCPVMPHGKEFWKRSV